TPPHGPHQRRPPSPPRSFSNATELLRRPPDPQDFEMSAIDEYRQMLRSMRDHGLTPIVTLNHMSLPAWVCTPPTEGIFVTIDVESGWDGDAGYLSSLKG